MLKGGSWINISYVKGSKYRLSVHLQYCNMKMAWKKICWNIIKWHELYKWHKCIFQQPRFFIHIFLSSHPHPPPIKKKYFSIHKIHIHRQSCSYLHIENFLFLLNWRYNETANLRCSVLFLMVLVHALVISLNRKCNV